MRQEILALVAERAGMWFAPNRHTEAEAGIARAMKHAGTRDLAAYVLLIRGSTHALDDLVDELRVGETHFMRDPGQFELVRREVLSAVRQRRGPRGAIRVWSAGCATGEEAYSLAILLEEEGLEGSAAVLGTDFSAVALAKARAASYSEWSMRGVSEQFLQNYFLQRGGRRVLVDRIRNRVRFARLNLVAPGDYAAAGASEMDLILCRNVLVYFDHQTTARIAARLFDCLAEGGVLLTAGADPRIGEYAPFDVEVTRTGLVYRRPISAPPIADAPLRQAALPAASHVTVAVPADRQKAAPVKTPPPASAEPGRQAFEQVLVLANGIGAFEAEVMAQAALRRLPLDAQLHYLRASLLLALDRFQEAEDEAQRALYLDRSLAVAHFLLGTILGRRGARRGALRAFRNARDLCAARPSDEEVPAGAGELVGALRSAASAELERLEVTVAG